MADMLTNFHIPFCIERYGPAHTAPNRRILMSRTSREEQVWSFKESYASLKLKTLKRHLDLLVLSREKRSIVPI